MFQRGIKGFVQPHQIAAHGEFSKMKRWRESDTCISGDIKIKEISIKRYHNGKWQENII